MKEGKKERDNERKTDITNEIKKERNNEGNA